MIKEKFLKLRKEDACLRVNQSKARDEVLNRERFLHMENVWDLVISCNQSQISIMDPINI